MDNRKWFKGDTHLHTINSDGVLTKGQLVDRCKQMGLDFMIITDHNFNSVKESYYDGDMLIIQGQEITGDNGHVNIWGAKVPEEPPYKLDTKEDYQNIIKSAKKREPRFLLTTRFVRNADLDLILTIYIATVLKCGTQFSIQTI